MKSRYKVIPDEEQAEIDFLSLCRSFGESDDEDVVRPPPRVPMAPSTRGIQPTASARQLTTLPTTPSSPLTSAVHFVPEKPPSGLTPPENALHSHNEVGYNSGSPTFASLDDDGDGDGALMIPFSDVEQSIRDADEGTLFLLGGKDDAWWAAEYARRDAAFPREERARKACNRYYQRFVYSVDLQLCKLTFP